MNRMTGAQLIIRLLERQGIEIVAELVESWDPARMDQALAMAARPMAKRGGFNFRQRASAARATAAPSPGPEPPSPPAARAAASTDKPRAIATVRESTTVTGTPAVCAASPAAVTVPDSSPDRWTETISLAPRAATRA